MDAMKIFSAILFRMAKGVPKDKAEALKWYRKCAEHNSLARDKVDTYPNW
jgi:TPR repeat protein